MGRRDWALLSVLAVLWGGSFFFVELALAGLPPLAVVWCRVALGALVLGVMLRAWGVALPAGWAQWRAVAVMGVLNNALPFTFFALAQGRIGGGVAAILNAMTPMLMPVMNQRSFFMIVTYFFSLRNERTPEARPAIFTSGEPRVEEKRATRALTFPVTSETFSVMTSTLANCLLVA